MKVERSVTVTFDPKEEAQFFEGPFTVRLGMLTRYDDSQEVVAYLYRITKSGVRNGNPWVRTWKITDERIPAEALAALTQSEG